MLLTVAVTVGVDSTDEIVSALIFPLTFPPSAVIDCHDPLLSPYEYDEPVE